MKRVKVYAVRVIVDTRDATLDYFLPETYAQDEFDAGRLAQIQIGRTWFYEDPQRRHVACRIVAKELR